MNLSFRTPAPAPAPLAIPRLEDVSEAYAALQAKWREVSQEQGRLEAERQALIMRLRESHGTNPNSGKRVSTEQDRRVAEILGETVAPATQAVTLNDEITALDKRIADLAAAARVLNDRLGAERLKASAIICREVEPQYRALMTELAAKMCELVHVAGRYNRFAVTLNDMDVAWARLDPMSQDVGGVTWRGSPFRSWLEGAMSRGFADRSQLPEAQR